MILPQTAAAYGGWCAVCERRSREKVTRNIPKELLRDLMVGIRLPLEAVFLCVRWIVRKWRFPHDQKKLLLAIAEVYPEPRVARSYLGGVIKGYFENSGESFTWGSDQARWEGRNDGGRLWRGEITLSDIPTCRSERVGRVKASGQTVAPQGQR